MSTFAGFPSGKNPYVPVPEIFFTRILPQIQESTELKVTLHLFWLLSKKQSGPRCTNDHELFVDRLLLKSLKRTGDPRPAEERIRQGLEQAVARGTLLRVYLHLATTASGVIDEEDTHIEQEYTNWYFFNTERNQKVIAELEGGEILPARLFLLSQRDTLEDKSDTQEKILDTQHKHDLAKKDPTATNNYEKVKQIYVEIDRPNIFTLYEQHIGLLTPLIAEDLKDAMHQYPADWIEAAFREAMFNNKRTWKYIRAILRRWETEGKQQWKA